MNTLERFAIAGGSALLPSGFQDDVVITVNHGVIVEIGSEANGAPVMDARGLRVMPGIIDLHGDAFERQIMPRPGVHFDLQLALAETDRQLVANGISTAFHGVTFSWEPGLRSRDTLVRLMAAMDAAKDHLSCDARLHLRHETFNLDGEDEVLDWLAEGRIALLAFNDHTADILRKIGHPKDGMTVLQRTGLTAADLQALAERVAARRDEVPASIRRLAAAALAAGVPMASHDDPSPEVRTDYQSLGCNISEFPKTRETAVLARQYGNPVVFGAPNVVRGGSHMSNAVSAAVMARAGLCTVLTSDYYYPAMLPAALRLSEDGACDLASAWAMISSNAADAAGLSDRGRLAVGLRADIVLVRTPAGRPPSVAAHVIGGHLAFAAKGAPRFHAPLKAVALETL
ncbi:alpha-D-ribose 1-methylphosphonate 5-triphosphate diphosphatase [Hydrogenophaga aromaticivorans]|uniref:alpha-D-ribose 1-methylphosphonate 5-triphosphate diphosphatase n=1 Tax=Hydrogenophaga aromaticivorans TaxID=2610898 RepID=UPI001B35FFDF|nr:alpha-D-ribose 1-methylphosphonate 5-triphosphate diphosphatase [Hydrogenophaga aromaticivorans]MBQ0917124.1 alpha-D-ribose 1-methylphosphonate 5-triphosphate diphosphatase [Hydrogenophaga aromaticivorans]